jgi:hypothetical protein
MNPDTNKFEPLILKEKSAAAFEVELHKHLECTAPETLLVRPNGSPVPDHWSIFEVGKNYEINGYTFKCAYIGETSILFEPVGPILIGEEKP